MSVTIEDIYKNYQILGTHRKFHAVDSLNSLPWSNKLYAFSITLSNLTNLFNDSPENCILKSLITTITEKNSNHLVWCCIFNSFTELNFSTIIVQIP